MATLTQSRLRVRRVGPTLTPDRSRVLIRRYYPTSDDIARRIFSRVMTLSNQDAEKLLEEVMTEFQDRHENIERIFLNRFQEVRSFLDGAPEPSVKRQALIGSHFTHEYSPEAAALFNPSIVLHPDQSGLPVGSTRFVMSLRAVGEGHVSSITFRVGEISARGLITLWAPVPLITEPELVPDATYDKAIFARKMQNAGIRDDYCPSILEQLPEVFVLDDLRRALRIVQQKNGPADRSTDNEKSQILLLAESNYEVNFDPSSEISQRLIFPSTPSQRNGIEDARFVRFEKDDGSFTYYATYTAYDGRITIPQLLETRDFVHFKFSTLDGPAVQNKGMALFPRMINGQYVMLSRQDDENILIMSSDNIHFWQKPTLLLSPSRPWEFFKMGNCGSPLETEEGWLVISHGVGAMRKYSLGAFLLDLNDPTRVIGRLTEPLLAPNESERVGYVPNVVYTCGALLRGRELVIPYAMSDSATTFATVHLDEILRAME